MLLLHDLASNARIWEKVAILLANRNFSLIAPDLRGHGLTDKPENSYDFETILRDLLAFIEAAHLERPLLVGHSWGGLLALEYAARFSFGPRAPSGLLLMDGGLTQMDDAPGASWDLVKQKLDSSHSASVSLEYLLHNLSIGHRKWIPDEQDIQAILANYEIDEQETVSPRLGYDQHLQILRAVWDFKTYERFERLKCPVSAVLAMPSPPYSSEEEYLLELKRRGLAQAQTQINDLRIHWIEDCNHVLPLDQPHKLADLIAALVPDTSP